MRWRSVDNTGASIHCDVVRHHTQNCAVQKRMGKIQIFELLSGKVGKLVRGSEASFVAEFRRELLGDDVYFALGFGFERHIFFVGMKSDSHRRGQRPGRGGPDYGKDLLSLQNGIELRRVIPKLILHPYSRTGMVLVFDFRFRQRSFIVNAPIDRAQSFIYRPFFEKRIKLRYNG